MAMATELATLDVVAGFEEDKSLSVVHDHGADLLLYAHFEMSYSFILADFLFVTRAVRQISLNLKHWGSYRSLITFTLILLLLEEDPLFLNTVIVRYYLLAQICTIMHRSKANKKIIEQ